MSDYLRNMINNQSITPPATLIKGATLLSMDDRVGNFERGDILIEGAKIVAIGENLAAEGARIIDATHMIAMPGLVDTHRHAWEGQLRRINPDAKTLEDYCNATHFSFARYYRPADIYIGNLLTALECIDAGITTMIDNSHNSRTAAHSDAAVEALLDAGIRAVHASGAPCPENGTARTGPVIGSACKKSISRITLRVLFRWQSWPSWSRRDGWRPAGWGCQS